MRRSSALSLAGASVGIALMLGACGGSASVPTDGTAVTAIVIALEPDAALAQRAATANARLRRSSPDGFAFDATHHPHLSLLQRFVRTADLEQAFAAVGRVLADERAADLGLKATHYFAIPWNDGELVGIVVEPTDGLRQLQRRLIDAIAPFTMASGSAAAFMSTPIDPAVDALTIDYVAAFVPQAVGDAFKPHISVGVVSRERLAESLAEPFTELVSTPAGVSVYQLGNLGTARRQLKAWRFDE